MTDMEDNKFNEIVTKAAASLPQKFRKALKNIEIVVKDLPNEDELIEFEDREDLEEGDHYILLGLYQGVPLPERSVTGYNLVLPDKITLFRKSIEEICHGDENKMEEEIKRTFLHEIGHYFGIDDEKLRELGF